MKNKSYYLHKELLSETTGFEIVLIWWILNNIVLLKTHTEEGYTSPPGMSPAFFCISVCCN